MARKKKKSILLFHLVRLRLLVITAVVPIVILTAAVFIFLPLILAILITMVTAVISAVFVVLLSSLVFVLGSVGVVILLVVPFGGFQLGLLRRSLLVIAVPPAAVSFLSIPLVAAASASASLAISITGPAAFPLSFARGIFVYSVVNLAIQFFFYSISITTTTTILVTVATALASSIPAAWLTFATSGSTLISAS